MRVYFDPSAYAKRYIDEHGTQEVLAWCEQATELVLSVIAIPELISALCRMRREARLTSNQYRRIKWEWRQHGYHRRRARSGHAPKGLTR